MIVYQMTDNNWGEGSYHLSSIIYHLFLILHPLIISMAEKKSSASSKDTRSFPIFEKDNYLWMLGGIVIMAIGLLLMVGGKSDDPNQFHPEQVYSTTRITIAPILIIAGLVLECFALFRKPKAKE